MTHHNDHNQSTSNAQQNTHNDSGIGPTGRLHDEENVIEIRLINIDNCTADVIYNRRPDSNVRGTITFGYTGELRNQADLRAAVYHTYKGMYHARQQIGTKLKPPDARAKLFHSFAENCPIAQAYNVPQNLSEAAEYGINDAKNNLDTRSKEEICYRILLDESHLDLSNAEPL